MPEEVRENTTQAVNWLTGGGGGLILGLLGRDLVPKILRAVTGRNKAASDASLKDTSLAIKTLQDHIKRIEDRLDTVEKHHAECERLRAMDKAEIDRLKAEVNKLKAAA